VREKQAAKLLFRAQRLTAADLAGLLIPEPQKASLLQAARDGHALNNVSDALRAGRAAGHVLCLQQRTP
jgi:hypothetical protein